MKRVDVWAMLAEMTSSELTAWMAFFKLEPFGELRADFREAAHMALVANMNRKKGSKRFKPEDFMPVWDERDRAQSDAQAMMAAFMALTKQADR